MEQALKALLRDGFILVFNKEELDVVRTAEALQKAGLSQMELTCRVREPLEKLERLKNELPEFCCGAASILDFENTRTAYKGVHPDDPLPSVDELIDAGADYLVSACEFSDKTYAKHRGRLPIIPGCGTVSEIVRQYDLGATCCKLFPASVVGGPKLIKSMDSAIHRLISVIPTGGTDCESIPEYIDTDVLVVGGSFSAIDKYSMQKIVEEQDYQLLAEELKKIKALIDDCRKRKWPALDFETADIDEITRVTGRCFNRDNPHTVR